ncbi:sulfatase [Mangrovimonas futianensis]|uniref:sulfatase n=1 Tax=Mangrovimonas futianensis TaxID=2895523 RepID=UPI001E43FAE8|nr:sulfatase [Mangrovimonas futianensis]MCF1420506.1 sulfatase [Mangrovimonas futianensis]
MKHIKISVIMMAMTLFACHAQKGPKQSEAKNDQVQMASAKNQKNILFIAVDDLKPLLSNYGQEEMVTPNFDRLADMGITFTNAHVQYAVCGPSRASVMTGTYPDRTKVWDLHTDFREVAPDLMSMPEYLISQGYETTGVGKIYHKGSSSPGHDGKSWSLPHQLPDPEGDPAFNTYQDPRTKAEMNRIKKEAIDKGKKKYGQISKYVFNKIKPSSEGPDVPDTYYQDGVYTKTAIQQLESLMASGKPWFEAVGFQRPHLPFNAPKKYWDLYKREEIKIAEFQELSEGTPRLAFHNFGELRSYSDIPNNQDVGEPLPVEKQKELIHGYMACVSFIDAQIGILLDFLEEKGALENTVIVLWGDHGFHLGDHTEWCKHSNFEQATRIPFMFAGPGVEKGQVDGTPVELVDLFPTVFELAGVKKSGQTEGKSLVALMDGDPTTNMSIDGAFHQYARGKRMGYSIRTERFRYTEWHDNDYRSYLPYKDSNIVGRELYDYQRDPLETKNHVNDKAYASEIADLKAKLKKHLESRL